jgi:hypothetical protein
MDESLYDLISDAAEAAEAGGTDRAIALDYAARIIQGTEPAMPLLVARRIAERLLPAARKCSAAA